MKDWLGPDGSGGAGGIIELLVGAPGGADEIDDVELFGEAEKQLTIEIQRKDQRSCRFFVYLDRVEFVVMNLPFVKNRHVLAEK